MRGAAERGPGQRREPGSKELSGEKYRGRCRVRQGGDVEGRDGGDRVQGGDRWTKDTQAAGESRQEEQSVRGPGLHCQGLSSWCGAGAKASTFEPTSQTKASIIFETWNPSEH